MIFPRFRVFLVKTHWTKCVGDVARELPAAATGLAGREAAAWHGGIMNDTGVSQSVPGATAPWKVDAVEMDTARETVRPGLD